MHFHISSSNSKGAKLKWQEEKLLNSNTWWKSWGKMTNYIVVKLKQQQSRAVSGVRKKQKWQEPENFCRWLGLKITESVVEKLDELMQYSGATSFQSAQDDWCNFRIQLIPWQRKVTFRQLLLMKVLSNFGLVQKEQGVLDHKGKHQKLRQEKNDLF